MAAGVAKRNILESMKSSKGNGGADDKIPYRDAQGAIIGINRFSIDVTDQHEREGSVTGGLCGREATTRGIRTTGDQLKIASRAHTYPECADSRLPVCKKIRDDGGRWQFLEAFY